MVGNAEAVLGFYFLIGISSNRGWGVGVAFNDKSRAWLIAKNCRVKKTIKNY
ncbi:hypothetical protein Kyoto148B_09630 [Helicobacter pylori]